MLKKSGTWAVHAFGRISTVLFLGLLLLPVYPADADAQGRRKKITFGEDDTDVVEGYVHKPEVAFLLTRQEQEDLETLQLKENFIPKIVKSVEKAPF
jgi:hypothetical protein